MKRQDELLQDLDPVAVERKRCIQHIRSQLKSAIAISRQQEFQMLEYMLKMADLEAEMFLEEPPESLAEAGTAQIH